MAPKKKTCTCGFKKNDARLLALFLFLFTLPLFSFWAGYQIATLGGLTNQMTIVDDARVSTSTIR